MSTQHKISEIMTRDVVSLLEEDNLQMVAKSLQRFRFHHLPVLDGRRLVGMVSQRDLLRNTVAGVDRSAVAQVREARFMEQTFVRDVMQTEVLTASRDESIASAAARMLEARVGALPVVNSAGELLGIVTEHDLLRFLASQGKIF